MLRSSSPGLFRESQMTQGKEILKFIGYCTSLESNEINFQPFNVVLSVKLATLPSGHLLSPVLTANMQKGVIISRPGRFSAPAVLYHSTVNVRAPPEEAIKKEEKLIL